VTDNEKHNRVVALRFADGLRVDIEFDATHFDAIASMTARAMRSDQPPMLPLYEAATAIIPADRLAQPLNGNVLAFPAVIEPVRQPVPVAGLLAIMRAYGPATISTAGEDIKQQCAEKLRTFFDHYGVAIEFNSNTPEWLKEHRRTVTDAWTG
jgi:hypothetical protein